MKPTNSRRVFLRSLMYYFLSFSSLKVFAKDDPPNKLQIEPAFRTKDEIVINRPIAEVFLYVINLQNADKISDHLTDIKILKNENGSGDQYSRKLIIHGVSNHQIVTITKIENERLYQTSTNLFGVKVLHTYSFFPRNNDSVVISLAKESFNRSWIDKIFQPFIRHQLTRPEHDGQHLLVLGRAIDSV